MNNDADRLAKRLSNAFGEAALPASQAVFGTMLTVGMAVDTQNYMATAAFGFVPYICTLWAVRNFTKGLEKPLEAPQPVKAPSQDRSPG